MAIGQTYKLCVKALQNQNTVVKGIFQEKVENQSTGTINGAMITIGTPYFVKNLQ